MKTPRKRPKRSHRRPAEVRSLGMGPTYMPGMQTLAGTTVTPQTALTFTAFFAGVNVIATDIASLPLGVFRRKPDGTVVPAPEHPAGRLVSVAPNDDQNAFRFRQAQMGHVLSWGNSPSEVVRSKYDGAPTAIHLLNPAHVKPRRDGDGPLYYKDENTGTVWQPEDVVHVAGIGFDGLTGYSPVAMARQAIGLGLGAEEFGSSFFGNGAVPLGILSTPKRLTEAGAKNLRDSFDRVHRGPRHAHRTAILEEGLTYTQTQLAPELAQFLATRQFQVIEIARLLRLPPHKLGDYTHSHLANIEESNLDYLQTTLLGWVQTIEAELNWKLFGEAERDQGYFIRHNMGELMRGNSAARVTYYEGMTNMSVMSVDEVRTAEGMNPIGAAAGGNLRRIQVQYVPLQSLLSNMVTPGPAKAALPGPGKATGAAPATQADPVADHTGSAGAATGRATRFNPNHDEMGRFSAGGGGGGARAALRGPEAHAAEVQARVNDVRHEAKPAVVADQAELRAEHAADRKEHAADVRTERRQLVRDQAKESRAEVRDQARADAKLARDQAKEATRMEARHAREAVKSTAPDRTAARHAAEKAEQAEQHANDRQQQAADHAERRQSLAVEHKEAVASARQSHLEDVDGLRQTQREDMADRLKAVLDDRRYAKEFGDES